MPWLEDITLSGEMPLRELLDGACFYPASGFDGEPVRILGQAGLCASFVYVDYAATREALETSPGFRGYSLIAARDVQRTELAPDGWTPVIRPSADEARRFDELVEGGFLRRDMPGLAFCRWQIYERQDGYGDDHGPHRFSLLYLMADAAAAFQALWLRLGVAPHTIAIIRPGTGWGGNYTNFTMPESILHRSIFANPQAAPRHVLLEYGFHDGIMWPEVSQQGELRFPGRAEGYVLRRLAGR